MNGYAAKLAQLRLAVDRPGRVELRHPVTGDYLAAADGRRSYVLMRSRDSDEWQRRDREVIEARNRKIADGLKYTQDDAVRDLTETLAGMTMNWFLVDLYGNAIDEPYSFDVAMAIYADPGLSWLRDQAYAGSGDRSLFMPARSGG